MSTPDPTPGQPTPPLAPSGSQETVDAQRVIQGTVVPGHVVQVAIQPTQVRRPWKATARTVFQALVALAVLFPLLVQTAGLDPAKWPLVGVALAIAGGLARIMALPQVETFLRTFAPFLSAAPKENSR